MRWPWSSTRTGPMDEPTALARLEADDLARLEVVELDRTGAWVADERPSGAARPIHELAYGPARDGTGLAGIWEALAER